MKVARFDISDKKDLHKIAEQLSQTINAGNWVYLQGDLGAGKTTFAQHFIRCKDCDERVTSPTYALMQDYHTTSGVVIHCDLYRMADPEELYEIGLLDLAAAQNAIVLVEWAEKGGGVLPQPDLTLAFDITNFANQHRQLTVTYHDR